ncbi:MAG: hypothetical protein M1821_006235 [Bathelium mastoideum]|nr:MAG: hypothetical protein M1821_006235 [Bathelium mastoideum]KAI9686574.1 MAG: hypothetical protein M1822_003585 [Bathelium mastoideum]
MDIANDEEAFAISEDLVQSPDHKAAGVSVVDFEGLLSQPLKLHEDLKNGCGGQLWPAGMVLGKYLLRQHRNDFKNKSIIELGAGGGLVGLAVALGCETDEPLWITDQEPMFRLMKENIALNTLTGKAKPALYDWGSPVPSFLPKRVDIVLAADCVYFEPAFPLLQQTLCDLMQEDTICYFCFKKRRRADMQFMKTARRMFYVQEVNDDPDGDIYRRQNIFL